MSTSKLIAGVAIGVVVGAGGYYLASKNMVEPMSPETAPQVATVMSATPATFNSGEAAINYRKAVMKAIGGHMGAMGATLKDSDGVGSVADHAAAMADLAKMVPTLFPENSGPSNGDTDTLPAAWEKKDELTKIAMAFEAEAAKLADIAKSGDKAAIGAQLGAMGKNGCKACHDDFRQKK